jgi:hypothetical protein
MTPLLYFAAYFSLFALFASAVAATFWVLIKFVRVLTTPPSVRKARREAAVVFDTHHLKRAGQ